MNPYRAHRSAPTLTSPIPTLVADILRASSAVHAGGAFGREGKEEEHLSQQGYFSKETLSGEQQCSERRNEFADVICKEGVEVSTIWDASGFFPLVICYQCGSE